MQAGPGDDDGGFIENGLGDGTAPEKNENHEEKIGAPRQKDFAGSVARFGARFIAYGCPKTQQKEEGAHGSDGGEKAGQVGADVARNQELNTTEGHTADNRSRECGSQGGQAT